MSAIKKDNREHSFDIELATIVGLNKAILLKNVSYWCAENERRNDESTYLGGKWWTKESVRSLERKYPYFAKTSISRWMSELHVEGWIRSVGQLGGENMYALGPVYEAWNLGQDWEIVRQTTLSQNGTPPGLSQNGTPTVPKWDTWVSQNGTQLY